MDSIYDKPHLEWGYIPINDISENARRFADIYAEDEPKDLAYGTTFRVLLLSPDRDVLTLMLAENAVSLRGQRSSRVIPMTTKNLVAHIQFRLDVESLETDEPLYLEVYVPTVEELTGLRVERV